MGTYTVYTDSRIDRTIGNHLLHIVSNLKQLPLVRAIILGGGFGRGEGSVLLDSTGIHPVNDYDIYIIVSEGFREDVRSLSKDVAEQIGIRLIDIIPIKYSDLPNLPPNQYNYDLKYGGHHLWGEDVLGLIPLYKEGIVDKDAGKTLLLNRLICGVEAYSEKFERSGLTVEENVFLVNQTGKIVSACVEALLIRINKYHHSYSSRQHIFEREYPDKLKLRQLNEIALEFKLRPTKTLQLNSIQYWKDAIEDYLIVFADYLFDSGLSYAEDLWKNLKTNRSSKRITNNVIERLELLLLLYMFSSNTRKKQILAKIQDGLKSLDKVSYRKASWDELRARAATLWHKAYH